MFDAMASRNGLDIGLVAELLGSAPRPAGEPEDFDAEYEPVETLEVLEEALRGRGHRPQRLGRPHDLLKAGRAPVDAVLSIAEGFGTRNREAWVPVLLEMLEIPRLGSDALTLSLSLDKAWARSVVADAGVPVAPGGVMRSADDAARWIGGYPVFVKPRFEGSSKGIGATSRAENENELSKEVDRIVAYYRQPALVEAFLPGAEYTVCVSGNDPPQTYPVLQRALDPRTAIGYHALTRAAAGSPDDLPTLADPVTEGALAKALEEALGERAIVAYKALECLDFARVDFKLDRAGEPMFLEINPLPTFALDGSFAIVAELEGRPYPALLGEILDAGLRRLGLLR